MYVILNTITILHSVEGSAFRNGLCMIIAIYVIPNTTGQLWFWVATHLIFSTNYVRKVSFHPASYCCHIAGCIPSNRTLKILITISCTLARHVINTIFFTGTWYYKQVNEVVNHFMCYAYICWITCIWNTVLKAKGLLFYSNSTSFYC